MPRYLWDHATWDLFDDELALANLPEPPPPPGELSGQVYWELWIDTSGKGLFNNPQDKIPPADILSVEWRLGLEPYQAIARPARATIVLDNRSGRYSPERAEALAGFTRHRAVKLVSGGFPFVKTDAEGNFTGSRENVVTTQQMFILRIAGIEPEPNPYGVSRTTRITAEDTLSEAALYPVQIPVQLGKFASEILAALLKQSGLYPPGTVAGWVLGETPLGQARLGLMTQPTRLDQGTYQYPYAMDTGGAGASLYDAIRTVVETENGRFFINRSGQWEFWDRAHMWVRPDAGYVIDGSMLEMDYAFGGEVVNVVEVRYRPRTVTTTGTPVLATLGSAISLKAGSVTAVSVSFRDENGNPLASTSVIKPSAGTDYVIKDRNGVDRTGQVLLTVRAFAQSAELTFHNGSPFDCALQAGARIRGNDRITAFGEQSLVLRDTDSIKAYGPKPHPNGALELRFVESAEQAREIAQDILDTRSEPSGAARRIRLAPLGDPAAMTLALRGAVGARIRLREAHTGHDREYFVIGEEHALREGGRDYAFWLVLEPAQDKQVWILGHPTYSRLGITTKL